MNQFSLAKRSVWNYFRHLYLSIQKGVDVIILAHLLLNFDSLWTVVDMISKFVRLQARCSLNHQFVANFLVLAHILPCYHVSSFPLVVFYVFVFNLIDQAFKIITLNNLALVLVLFWVNVVLRDASALQDLLDVCLKRFFHIRPHVLDLAVPLVLYRVVGAAFENF